MPDAAVLQQKADLHPVPDPGPDRFLEGRTDALAILGVDLPEGIGTGLDLPVLEHAAVRGAVVDAPALGIHHGDEVADVFRYQAKAFLALAQLLLGAPVLGNVTEAPDPTYRLAVDELRPGIALEDPAVLELDD